MSKEKRAARDRRPQKNPHTRHHNISGGVRKQGWFTSLLRECLQEAVLHNAGARAEYIAGLLGGKGWLQG